MEIYKEKKIEKSWSIKLAVIDKISRLTAVDTTTGEYICDLIVLGHVIGICPNVSTILEKKGYNPFEHGNEYDEDDGSLSYDFA